VASERFDALTGSDCSCVVFSRQRWWFARFPNQANTTSCTPLQNSRSAYLKALHERPFLNMSSREGLHLYMKPYETHFLEHKGIACYLSTTYDVVIRELHVICLLLTMWTSSFSIFIGRTCFCVFRRLFFHLANHDRFL